MALRTVYVTAKRNQQLATIVINRGPTGPKGDPGDVVGGGTGDMAAATYDPQGIADDAFDMANMTEGADAKVMTAAERASIAALGTALGLKADTASLSTVATTGAYADLTGTPALVVNFADLGDAATVDLPTINGPLGTALDGKAPLSHTHTVSQITDFPTLATVATSGAYADLTGTPSLVVNFGDLGDATTVDLPTVNSPLSTALGLKADTSSLSTVATTGAYSDLSGTPTLATVATSGAYSDLTGTPTIPSDNQVSEYLVDDGIHTLTSSGGTVTVDASNGHVQKFPLTENAVMGTPSNLSDGESMRIDGTQDATSRTLSFTGFNIHGGGAASDIGSLAALKGFTLSIWRVGGEYRLSIVTEV